MNTLRLIAYLLLPLQPLIIAGSLILITLAPGALLLP